ncbi:hypothetical protein B296_00034834 [Ensete ventricosum]|uniref:DUF4005 domain-containing protein n=1 Tax=Ensete ventricosum TaxID=4639 RepID=A0A426ZIR3_ENSVE|nr:hypothetical protein B296_00034834 [Ensete ventricosum]
MPPQSSFGGVVGGRGEAAERQRSKSCFSSLLNNSWLQFQMKKTVKQTSEIAAATTWRGWSHPGVYQSSSYWRSTTVRSSSRLEGVSNRRKTTKRSKESHTATKDA